jgi:hypothetical protein
MVEDLAVISDDDLAAFVCHGLRPAGRINYAEADVRESDPLAHVEAVGIGTAVPNRGGHPAKQFRRDSCRYASGNARYAGHQVITEVCRDLIATIDSKLAICNVKRFLVCVVTGVVVIVSVVPVEE